MKKWMLWLFPLMLMADAPVLPGYSCYLNPPGKTMRHCLFHRGMDLTEEACRYRAVTEVVHFEFRDVIPCPADYLALCTERNGLTRVYYYDPHSHRRYDEQVAHVEKMCGMIHGTLYKKEKK